MMEDNFHPLNPLTIDVVVPVLLRHVTSIQDLLAFRQVCRLWREFATPKISSRSLELPEITFKAEMQVEHPVGFCDGSLALSKYVDYLEWDFHPKIIFSNLHFDGIWMDHPIVRRFLEEFGQTVKGLYLNKIKMESNYFDQEYNKTKSAEKMEGIKPLAFPQLLLSCPNLEELVLSCDLPGNETSGFLMANYDFQTKIRRVAWIQFPHPHSHQHLDIEETFIRNLLQVCPSLERFQNVENSDRGFTRALAQSPFVSSLKELELTFGNATVFRQLQELRLKKLKIRKVRVQDVSEFREFLETQKSGLESLNAGEWTFQLEMIEQPPIQFPDVMDKLQVLNIGRIQRGYEFKADRTIRQLRIHLDFRRQFPLLKTLILRGDAKDYDLNDLFAPGMESQLVLEGLELPGGIEFQEMTILAQLFPNVKELKLRRVDAPVLRLLWRQWRGMESLFLDNVDLTESILTGLSPKQISIVDSLIKEKKEINTTEENSSVLRFQNLKELRILNVRRNYKANLLTDVSIHSTLSKLPKLEFLTVNCHSHKFTERGITHLCNTRELKWIKNPNRRLQFQKDLRNEYKPRPACNEDFPIYQIARDCRNDFN